jgi:HlyD family secretion protein
MRAACCVWLALLAVGCAPEAEPDAYGNVEAIDVVVGAEASGRLVTLDVTEGDRLAANAIVGAIDAVQLELERDRIAAERAASQSRVGEISRQIEALTAQHDAAQSRLASLESERRIAERAYERAQRLYDQKAATAPELDRAEREYRTLVEQARAQEQEVAGRARQVEAARAQQQTARQQVLAADSQIAQTGDRIRRSEISNPVAGTVLTIYARTGEFVQPGQPLYKIANLEIVDVRAYIAEPDLSRVRVGQPVQVSVDTREGPRRAVSGTIVWVSSEAEFTPTPIQTRQQRADLVYAIKVRIANEDGLLKIGMPVDLELGPAPSAPPAS